MIKICKVCGATAEDSDQECSVCEGALIMEEAPEEEVTEE